jgi:hypothetical protein
VGGKSGGEHSQACVALRQIKFSWTGGKTSCPSTRLLATGKRRTKQRKIKTRSAS